MEDDFQMEFQTRLQLQMGKLMFDNIGQGVRMELMAKENALLQMQLVQATQPKENEA